MASECDDYCIFRGRQLVSRYPVVSAVRGRKKVVKNCGEKNKVV